MPIYEYRCDGCNHELEKLQKIADEPLTSSGLISVPVAIISTVTAMRGSKLLRKLLSNWSGLRFVL